MKKILIIRLSSIGDIVLTTPVMRCLKQQLKDVEIHYLTKQQYAPLIQSNPYIDKIHTINKRIWEVIPQLKAQRFDHIIDLHKNIRSVTLLLALRKPFSSFPKLNFRKWMSVAFKINLLPDIHIVDRYMKALKSFNIINDNKGLDYIIPSGEKININSLPASYKNGYIAIVIGGKYITKQIPVDKIISIISTINKPVILLGGAEDKTKADIIKNSTGKDIFNACGMYNINQSASIVRQADVIITGDTGLMHIAAAFSKKIISIWGNTVPAFGMYPYLPKGSEHLSEILQVSNLRCRPCTKLGYNACPKKHFNCMNLINDDEIVARINNL